MSIKYRLYGGFGILVLVTLGLVLYGVLVFGDVGAVVTRMNSIATNNARTLQAEEYLEILRRTTLRYVYDRDETSRKENGEVAAKVLAALQGAEKSAPREERKKMYRDMQAGLASLQQVTQTLFDAVAQSTADNAKLVKAATNLGACMDEMIKKFVDNAAPDSDPAIAILVLKLDSQLQQMRVANLRGQLVQNTDMIPLLDDDRRQGDGHGRCVASERLGRRSCANRAADVRNRGFPNHGARHDRQGPPGPRSIRR